jgi:hypothetical protein
MHLTLSMFHSLSPTHPQIAVANDALFNSFASPAFFQFALFNLFEMRLLFAIHHARVNPTTGADALELRRFRAATWARFYCLLVLCILALLMDATRGAWIVSALIALIACSFWVPQIVACAIDDHRPPQSIEFIVGATVARALTPLYVFACPASGVCDLGMAGRKKIATRQWANKFQSLLIFNVRTPYLF